MPLNQSPTPAQAAQKAMASATSPEGSAPVPANLQELVEIMRRLRDPKTGCAWDRAQSFETIAPYTIEEAYEVADAIAREDMADLQDELGDLLLQIVYHAQIAQECGSFTIDDVITSICSKMIRRHPHIFGDAATSPGWEALKAAERGQKEQDKSVLAGVALALPALRRAEKIQRRAARAGFDWPSAAGPRQKISEELAEVDAAATEQERFAEIGDLLFSVVNYARHFDIDAETALTNTICRFEKRFRKVETLAQRPLPIIDIDELEMLWQRAKQSE